MRVCEGQDQGAAAILILSLLSIFGFTLLNDLKPIHEFSLPWGNQCSGVVTIEVNSGLNADGIYFFPNKIDAVNLLHTIGIESAIDAMNFAVSPDEAIVIYSDGGEMRIKDMPAVRQLVLRMSIDVNRASVKDLILIPGIGERLALGIIQRRDLIGKFNTFSELATIPGIKEKKLNSLKKYLRIGSTH